MVRTPRRKLHYYTRYHLWCAADALFGQHGFKNLIYLEKHQLRSCLQKVHETLSKNLHLVKQGSVVRILRDAGPGSVEEWVDKDKETLGTTMARAEAASSSGIRAMFLSVASKNRRPMIPAHPSGERIGLSAKLWKLLPRPVFGCVCKKKCFRSSERSKVHSALRTLYVAGALRVITIQKNGGIVVTRVPIASVFTRMMLLS